MQVYFELLKEQKIQNKIPDRGTVRRTTSPQLLDDLQIVTADASVGKAGAVTRLLDYTDMDEIQKKACLDAVLLREKDGQVALKDRNFLIFHCNIPGNRKPVLLFFTLDHGHGTHPDFKGFDKGVLMIVDKKEDKEIRDTLAVISEGFVNDEKILQYLENNNITALRRQIKDYLNRVAGEEGNEGL